MHNILLLFGATGDLAQRYLFPSLLRLFTDGLLPEDFWIRAISRSSHDTPTFHGILRRRLERTQPAFSAKQLDAFLARMEYVSVNMTAPDTVADAVRQLAQQGRCISFLSLPPSLYVSTCQGLAQGGALADPHRLMMEKPIGHDGHSADEILQAIGGLIDETRIFRLDHYLGKPTVQNVLAMRFGNAILEAVWNRQHIDSVQIFVAETAGVDGRDAYYAKSGALRDMVQSHLLQLLCFVAMEQPAQLHTNQIRDEKVKVLRALRPMTCEQIAHSSVRGRYTAGKIQGEYVQGYQPSDDVGIETFVGVTAYVDNPRWAGVPFYLCTGKRLAARSTQIVINYKPVAHWLFHQPDQASAAANRLVIHMQPEEHIQLDLVSSLTGSEWGEITLDSFPLVQANDTGLNRRIAYERLFIDAMHGQATLFVRDDEVRAAWAWIDRILAAWNQTKLPLLSYPAGSWGPKQARPFLPPFAHPSGATA